MSLLNNLLFEIQNGGVVVNTVLVKPDTPVMQPIIVSGITMTVNWLPVSGVTGYIVNFTPNINGVSSQSFDPTTTSASFSGIPGTSYNFTVTSVNVNKNSLESSPITITLLPPTPTNITISNSFSNIRIGWDLITLTGVTITYTINCSQGGLGTRTTTSNSIIFPGATSQTTYSFTITPSIGSINGSITSTPNITTSVSVIPSGGVISTITVGSTTYNLHTFTNTTSSSTFTVNTLIYASILVVGSGGGGGSVATGYYEGGGGGGGGEVFFTNNPVNLTNGTTCTITVGATTNASTNGNSSTCTVKNSSNTTLIDIIAKGGCRGGGSNSGGITAVGSGTGSGGGGCGINTGATTDDKPGSIGTISTYTSVDNIFLNNYTNLVNDGSKGNHINNYGAGGGGGGASIRQRFGYGKAGDPYNSFANGELGAVDSINTGRGGEGYTWIDSIVYGGGGCGGGAYYTSRPDFTWSVTVNYNGNYLNNGVGGYYSNNNNSKTQAPSVRNNSGIGGGGGYGYGGTGGSGGSGVVIIAYPV